ncbi:MAG: ABC transporter permease, partial [Ottowia sp.]|nr:ABC transporter permease [Ottowia sp.]
MSDAQPRLTHERAASGASVALQGQWTAQQLGNRRVWREVQRALAAAPADAAWDLSGAQAFDHLGALLLWQHWGRRWPHNVQGTDAQRAVLEHVAEAPAQAAALRGASLAAQFDALGKGVLDALAQLRDFIALMGQLALDFLTVLLAPRKMPWRDFSGSLHRIGAQALPITALVGFLIGVVLAYLMSQVLRQFGAETFIVNILGLALVRELGPLLGAVLVAGRSGSSITAQIGVMRVTEELDA